MKFEQEDALYLIVLLHYAVIYECAAIRYLYCLFNSINIRLLTLVNRLLINLPAG
ncbi:hypothetical protein HBA_0805 [Sodalis endosymbiont of Henestaris halophilus]|nr:hypothetical protein HBA_0805 [Sodalis endosymbiont of Henestaris halophilus]